MTEEEKLKQSPGCGSFIMLGLIGVVILSLVGLIFPGDVLPYPNEILIGILVISTIALIVAVCMWRGRVKDRQKEEDDKADELLRKGFETLGDKADEASRLAEKYYNEERE
ncbi:MAG: Bax inhibitor-1 family protein [Defluviitaleaceae bacterium]|nr:Bax inhibitor-1 family protein [Defluviitaleaceae bacterium]